MIVRVRSNGFDSHGDPITGEPERLTLLDAFTAPTTSNDVDDRGRQGVIERRTLYGKYGADVLSTDEVEVDGVLFRVDGAPGHWKHPWTGWEPGFEVPIVRAAG